MENFFKELKRRNVVKVAIAYLVVAWATLQFVDIVAPLMGLPEVFQKGVLVLLAVGAPIALLLSWAYEITPEGVKKTAEVDKSESITHGTGQKINKLIIGALVLALAFIGYDKVVAPGPGSNFAGEREASIAVLPFADLSAGQDQGYFADGISEEILNVLAQIPDLKVAGRTSSFKFKGHNEDLRIIGEQLGVAHVLEGSVRKDGGRIRITVQLVAADDGFHIWSETYDRQDVDIFAVQDEISKAVATALQVKLGTGDEKLVEQETESAEAYSLYLRARQFLHARGTENLEKAAKLFEAVTVLDPNFDEAYAGLARTYSLIPSYAVTVGGSAGESYKKGKAAAGRAIALNPQNSEAYSALTSINFSQLDWAEAEKNNLMATTLAPNDAEIANFAGDYYRFTGNFKNGLKWESRAFELDPLHVVNSWDLAFVHYEFHHPEQALPHAENALKLNPDYSFVYQAYTYALSALGRFDEAREGIARAEQGQMDPFILLDMKADLAAKEGNLDAAREILRQMAGMVDAGQGGPAWLYTRYLELGDVEEGLKWYERAYAENDPTLVTVPDFLPENFTDDPAIIARFEVPGMQELFDIRRKHRANGNGPKE